MNTNWRFEPDLENIITETIEKFAFSIEEARHIRQLIALGYAIGRASAKEGENLKVHFTCAGA